MAYATIPQADEGRHPLSSTLSSPTLPEFAHTPLSAAFEDLAGALFVDEPAKDARNKVADVLKSLTSSSRSRHSYELVRKDECGQSQTTPRLSKRMSSFNEGRVKQTSPGDLPVRTASISRNLPLKHPTPDLQSLQGAYLRNVERLESSAERLSMASSLEDELNRMKLEIRRNESTRRPSTASDAPSRQYSTRSMSNSIIAVNAAARAGGYSSAAFVTSPEGSIRSQTRKSSQKESKASRTSHLATFLPEPEMEGRPLDSDMVHSPPSHMVPLADPPHNPQPASASFDEQERPSTAASADTYRQAQNLFTDFDGTHFSPDEGFMSRRISLVQPPLARDSRAFREAQPGEKMIYYPAPVPVMLNLPKRLSRMDFGEQEKRRLKALSGIPDEMRKSAAWLANVETESDGPDRTRRASRPMSYIPPQLRASAFFDHPATAADVKLKDGSAVATLDSILDAAAHAPVSAFTDHPIAGHLGSEVYGQEARKIKPRTSEESKQKRRSSVSNLLSKGRLSTALTRRMSQPLDEDALEADGELEETVDQSIAPDADELTEDMKNEHDEDTRQSDAGHEEGDEIDHRSDDDEQSHQLGFLGAPTTLLAELQMRKAQQKLRNRTAANAFPNGMHSTLLELDAVAQLQQKSRKMKHVALAWEDQEAVSRENHGDDDVPLGLLFPEKEQQNHVNHHRPLGLMEKRELEENEPLSSRRARLRGEPYQPPMPPHEDFNRETLEPTPAVRLPGIDDDDEEEEAEEETLAQRAKRMKEKKDHRKSFADDIAGELGLNPEENADSKTPGPEVEETLGQRKKRLQQEALNKGVKPRTSMADLLQANPVGHRVPDRYPSNESQIPVGSTGQELFPQQQAHQFQTPAYFFSQPSFAAPPPYYPQQPLLGNSFQANGIANMSQGFGAAPNPYAGYGTPQMHMQMQMPGFNGMQGMNFGLGPGMNMGYHGMNMPMSVGQTVGYDAIGMGPPLNPQQRANIDRWRQGVA